MDAQLLLDYLDLRRSPVTSAAEQTHRRLCEASPTAYVALLADRASVISHKREALANLLTLASAREAPIVAMREALRTLPTSELLQALDVLPTRRINSHRARRLMRDILIGEDHLSSLAATHRRRLIHL